MNNIKLLREEDENELVQIPKNKRRKHSTRKKICREKMQVGTFRSVIFRRYTDTQNRRERARERKRETQTIQYNCTSLLFCVRCSLCVSSYNANNDVSAHSYETDFSRVSSSSSTNNANTNSNRELCVRACVCVCLPDCLLACACNVYLYVCCIFHNRWNNVLYYDYELAGLPACLPVCSNTVSFQSYVSWHKRRSNKYVHRQTHTRTRKHGNRTENPTTKTIETEEPNRKKTAWYSTERERERQRKKVKITNTVKLFVRREAGYVITRMQ